MEDDSYEDDDILMEDDIQYCDVCGSELDPEDYSIHLCKICQSDL